MGKSLSDIMNDIEEVKKNVLFELSLPIQKLVDMANVGEIESFSLIVKKHQEIGQTPYSEIIVKINNPAIAIIGTGEANKEELFGHNNNNISEENKEKLLNINHVLFAVNKYLGHSLPVNPKQHYTQDSLYFYSKDRKNITNSWTPEEAAKWPMLPDFLEGLVQLSEPIKKHKI